MLEDARFGSWATLPSAESRKDPSLWLSDVWLEVSAGYCLALGVLPSDALRECPAASVLDLDTHEDSRVDPSAFLDNLPVWLDASLLAPKEVRRRSPPCSLMRLNSANRRTASSREISATCDRLASS